MVIHKRCVKHCVMPWPEESGGNGDVFVNGRGSRPNIGRLTKIRKVCCRNSCRQRVIEHPLPSMALRALGVGAANGWLAPDVEF